VPNIDGKVVEVLLMLGLHEGKRKNFNFITLCKFNPLKTKRKLFYLKNQSAPRCKHFSSWL
jgi:hypothetical protein